MSPRPVRVSTFRYYAAAFRARLPRWRPRPRHATRDLSPYDAETIAVFHAANAELTVPERPPYPVLVAGPEPDGFIHCVREISEDDAREIREAFESGWPQDRSMAEYRRAIQDVPLPEPDPVAAWFTANAAPPLEPLPERDQAIRHYAGAAFINIGLRDPYAYTPDPAMHGSPSAPADATWEPRAQALTLAGRDETDGVLPVLGGAWEDPSAASGHTLGDTRDYAWRVRAATAVPEWAQILATCDRSDLARLIARDIDHCNALAGAA